MMDSWFSSPQVTAESLRTLGNIMACSTGKWRGKGEFLEIPLRHSSTSGFWVFLSCSTVPTMLHHMPRPKKREGQGGNPKGLGFQGIQTRTKQSTWSKTNLNVVSAYLGLHFPRDCTMALIHFQCTSLMHFYYPDVFWRLYARSFNPWPPAAYSPYGCS